MTINGRFAQHRLTWWIATSRPDSYEVTEQYLKIANRGILGYADTNVMIGYNDVKEVSFQPSIMGWLFGYGRVVLTKNDGTLVIMDYVKGAQQMADLLQELVIAWKQRIPPQYPTRL